VVCCCVAFAAVGPSIGAWVGQLCCDTSQELKRCAPPVCLFNQCRCRVRAAPPPPAGSSPQVMTEHDKPTGWDRVRGYEIGKKDYELAHMDEAFTSEHWIVRIFKVKKPANRAER